MADVGDFTPTQTTDPEAPPDTFTYFGQEFDIPATVGAGSLIEFTVLVKSAGEQSARAEAARRRALTAEARAQAGVMDAEAEMNATAAVYRLLSAVLGEGQMDRFLRVVDANGVQPMGLMELCDHIQGVIAARPTRRSVGSSDGPSTTGHSSTADGSGLTAPSYGTPVEMSPRDMQVALIEAASTPIADLRG